LPADIRTAIENEAKKVKEDPHSLKPTIFDLVQQNVYSSLNNDSFLRFVRSELYTGLFEGDWKDHIGSTIPSAAVGNFPEFISFYD